MNHTLMLLILILSLFSLVRMSVFFVSSDAYNLKIMSQKKKRRRWHLPKVTVAIPARNEEKSIERTLLSLYESNYPATKLEVIVVNDGSTDNTKELVQQFKREHKDRCKIRLLNRPNKGKAAALNYALKRSHFGSLVMCLDADSYLDRNAIRHAVQHFRDRQMVALSSNVNIVEDGTVLALVQRFEYLISYQMKKGQALLGMEYVVGGPGTMFRKSILEKVSFYDDDTLTEDMDLTLKIIGTKAKKQKIGHAADSLVYTEPVYSIGALIKQRYRWKYGRSQAYLKSRKLFFSTSRQYNWRLTWFMLPFTLLQELLFLFQPMLLTYFLYASLRYGEPGTFVAAASILTFYTLFNTWASDHLKIKERLRLTFYAPPMYFLMYLLAVVEYLALIKSLLLTPALRKSIKQGQVTWRSPARKGVSA